MRSSFLPYRAVLALPQRLTLRSRMFLPKRRPTIAELQLKKANDGLRTEIVNLRHELTNKQGYAERLEVLLRERMERIDELTARIDQLRERNKRLEAEAEHLAAIRLAGQPHPSRQHPPRRPRAGAQAKARTLTPPRGAATMRCP